MKLTHEHRDYRGHLAMLSANVIFGLFSPVSKDLLASGVMSSYALTLFRMFGAAAIFWIASAFLPREHVKPRDMGLLFFASLFGILMNQGFFIAGLSMTSPIDASVVTTTVPIITMILAAFVLQEPITGKKVSGIFIGAFGALMLIMNSRGDTTGGGNHFLGDLVCLLGELSFAIYLVVFKKLVSRYSAVTVMKWMFVYASICSVPFCYNDVTRIDYSRFTPETYAQLAYIVVFATFVAYLLIPIGQQRLRPTVVSMYTYVQPIIASLVAVAVGQDHFGWPKAIAALLVFVGVYVVTSSKSKAQMDAEARARLPRRS
ncbi:MAG: DMT family transporter [Rikenellaceae bacterium]|nr:DMT family transporter [Rikenellaceae bacterium]